MISCCRFIFLIYKSLCLFFIYLQSLSSLVPRHTFHSSLVISPFSSLSQYFQKFFAQPLFLANLFTERRNVLNSLLRSLLFLLWNKMILYKKWKLFWSIRTIFLAYMEYMIEILLISIHFIKLPFNFNLSFIGNGHDLSTWPYVSIFWAIFSFNKFYYCFIELYSVLMSTLNCKYNVLKW